MVSNDPPLLSFPWHECDAMFLVLIRRAAELAGSPEGSPQSEELDCLRNVIDAYAARRFSDASPGRRHLNADF